MSNPYTAEAEIDLGFEVITARFNWAVIARIQEERGQSTWLGSIAKIIEMRDIKGLAYLLSRSTKLSESELLEFADPPGGFISVFVAIEDVLKKSLYGNQVPESPKEASADPLKARPIWSVLHTMLHSGRASPMPNGSL